MFNFRHLNNRRTAKTRLRRKRSGSTGFRHRVGALTIEMAMVSPFVFFLIFSSIEFSRMMMIQQALTNAAREGARVASLPTTQADSKADQAIRDVLRPTMKNVSNDQIVRITISPAFDAVTPIPEGTRITATVQVDCADVSWAPGSLFGGVTIGANASCDRE